MPSSAPCARLASSPRNLELELTEGVLVESRDRTVAVLHGLKELGVQIAVDDFGNRLFEPELPLALADRLP